MFRFSKKMIYTLEAVVDIAYNGRVDPVQAKEITKRQGIPQRYLEQVMQGLVRAGILRGVRGPRGGYVLARERRRISVAEILKVVAALETGPENTDYESKSDLGRKVVKPLIDKINREIMGELEGISVDDLCTEASSSGIESEAARKFDFTI